MRVWTSRDTSSDPSFSQSDPILRLLKLQCTLNANVLPSIVLRLSRNQASSEYIAEWEVELEFRWNEEALWPGRPL